VKSLAVNSLFRYKIEIEGLVQGVGFRPFVYRLAHELKLSGWVQNDNKGVAIEVVGIQTDLEEFLLRLKAEKPTLASIFNMEVKRETTETNPFLGFDIRSSINFIDRKNNEMHAGVLSDLATCSECLKDIMDPHNRRYRYLFTNCTLCGPRYSILLDLPYDRKNTSMKNFIQCEECLSEYKNPAHRRFHAQPNACLACGPDVSLCNSQGDILLEGFAALEKIVEQLQLGFIVAIKGVGGYHLAAAAHSSTAVGLLRERKKRPSKPFAVMMASLDEVRTYCELSENEAQSLLSPAAPIVLLKCRNETMKMVAPNNPYLGVMLPHSPLHHWLMKLIKAPIVMTSANVSDEPLIYKESDLFVRLSGIADYFLIHNRPIVRPLDDSIVMWVRDYPLVIRAGRGLAPLTFSSSSSSSSSTGTQALMPTLAVGAHMKNTFALTLGSSLMVSQYLGDMESCQSQETWETELHRSLQYLHLHPKQIIIDAHPYYFTREIGLRLAEEWQVPTRDIQHHRAHIYATLADIHSTTPLNSLGGGQNYLAIAWDGTGYGDDGTLWGSEFFLPEGGEKFSLRRVAHWRYFRLLGGESAIRSPWRIALSLLFEIDISLAKRWFNKLLINRNNLINETDPSNQSNFNVIYQMWEAKLNAPMCCSLGRIWDGMASLLGLCHHTEYEAHAAQSLEYAATRFNPQFLNVQGAKGTYIKLPDLNSTDSNIAVWDWREWIRQAAEASLKDDFDPSAWAYLFHQMAVESMFQISRRFSQCEWVLGGGVFQNRLLVEMILTRAAKSGIKVHLPKRIPLNDGGISLGQIYNASSQAKHLF